MNGKPRFVTLRTPHSTLRFDATRLTDVSRRKIASVTPVHWQVHVRSVEGDIADLVIGDEDSADGLYEWLEDLTNGDGSESYAMEKP